MARIARQINKALKSTKKYSRNFYKATGLVNPMKKGKLSSSRLIKDVAFLKSIINAEKKRFQVDNGTTQLIGQVNANNSGHYLLDITPQPTQGVGYANRTGSSIKWHSSYLNFMFDAQANCVDGITLTMQLVQVNGLPYPTISNVDGKFLQQNGFITGASIYDSYCDRDPDYFKDFKVIKTTKVHLKADNMAGETQIVQKRMGITFKNQHVRWNDDGTTLSNGQVFLYITASRGNANPATASTLTGLSTASKPAGTGCAMRYSFMHYFYDN